MPFELPVLANRFRVRTKHAPTMNKVEMASIKATLKGKSVFTVAKVGSEGST